MPYDASVPQDRAIITLARSWGIAPSVFMGRDTGPAWTEDDRISALSLMEYENSLCPGCKHPLEETTKPENEYRYRAEIPMRCHRCTAIAMAGDTYQDAPHASALLLSVHIPEEVPSA